MALSAQLSPDGSIVAFVMRNEIFVCSGRSQDNQVVVAIARFLLKTTVFRGPSGGLSVVLGS